VRVGLLPEVIAAKPPASLPSAMRMKRARDASTTNGSASPKGGGICACGHDRGWHMKGTLACVYGRDTATGGCTCEGFHSRRRGAAKPKGDQPPKEAVHKDGELSKAEEAILVALLHSPGKPLEVPEIAIRAGYRPSGSFSAHLTSLRRAGYIETSGFGTELTPAGTDAVRSAPARTTGSEFLKELRERHGGAIATVAHALAAADYTDVSGLATACGYRPSGSFSATLTKLRLLGLMSRRGPHLTATTELQERVGNAAARGEQP